MLSHNVRDFLVGSFWFLATACEADRASFAELPAPSTSGSSSEFDAGATYSNNGFGPAGASTTATTPTGSGANSSFVAPSSSSGAAAPTATSAPSVAFQEGAAPVASPGATNSDGSSSASSGVAGDPSGVCERGVVRFCAEVGALGNCGQGKQQCLGDSWSECSVLPAAADTCDPGDDGNCNGIANEACGCVDGSEQTCEEGGLHGKCAAGKQVCSAGAWGACSIQPDAADTCDPDNDDNCNGNKNEGCPCTAGTERPCSDGGLQGPCAEGTQTCTSTGEWSECSFAPEEADSCSLGDDSNCDGEPNAPLDSACDCVEDDIRCAPGDPSTESQVCTSDGNWSTKMECSSVCTGEGNCTGDCTPGARECADNTPRECNDRGQWESEAECSDSSPCQGEGECKACGSGSFADDDGCAQLATCQAGQFVSAQGSATSNRQCSPCPQGQFSTTQNASSCTAMDNCGAGEFASNPGSSTSDRQCSPCGQGKFSTSQNATSCMSWTTCPAGSAEVTAGSATSDRTCGIPSCVGLTDSCGPNENESCCTSQLVTGGTFDRINNDDYPATVANFRLDKFEVTVGRFRNFKEAWDDGWRPTAGAGKHSHLNNGKGLVDSSATTANEGGWNSSWDASVALSDDSLECDSGFATWTESSGANEKRPISCVNWYQAYAFCIWDGGFLPSEAEFNFAAAGGSEQRVYPWSNPASATKVDFTYASYVGDADAMCKGDGVEGCTLEDLIPVGKKSKGNGRYVQADLGGNVAEWNLDWFAAPSTAFITSCTNCAYLPATANGRVLRGGSFIDDASSMMSTSRTSNMPTFGAYLFGARCARVP